jgi:hypothetical protein
MDNVVPGLRPLPAGQQQVFRARFSAVSAPEVQAAMVRRTQRAARACGAAGHCVAVAMGHGHRTAQVAAACTCQSPLLLLLQTVCVPHTPWLLAHTHTHTHTCTHTQRSLVAPNKCEALAVDARQELDLKVRRRVAAWRGV